MVAKGDRSPTAEKFVTGEALKLLCTYTIQTCKAEKHFPKRSRWVLSAPIVKLAVSAYSHAMQANGIEVTEYEDWKERRKHQIKCRAKLKGLLALVEIAEQEEGLDADKVAYWTSLIRDGMKYLNAWRESDRKRYRKIITDGKAEKQERREERKAKAGS